MSEWETHPSYSPEPKNGEVWENSGQQFGQQGWFPYHFDTCADIGESNISSCIQGCSTLAAMADSDGTMDYLWAVGFGLSVWHWFDDYQGWFNLGLHDYLGGITYTPVEIFGKCDYSTEVLNGSTGNTCTEEEADSNAIKATSMDSDTYQADVFEGDASQSSVFISAEEGDWSSSITRPLYSGEFKFGFGIARTCEEAVCPITIGEISGHAWDFLLEDSETSRNITQAKYYLSADTNGIYVSETNEFTILPGQAKFIFEFMFGSKHGNFVLNNTLPITGTIDLDAGTYTLEGSFSNSSASLDIDVAGNITEVPPIAETSIPAEIECNASYSADYSPDGTSQPYGVEKTHLWFVERDDGFVSDGEQVKVPELNIPMLLPEIGERTIKHIVFDDRQVFSDPVDVQTRVVDTTPPFISVRDPHATTCVPAPSWVFLEGVVFSVSDICTDNDTIKLSGEITAINSLRLKTPIPVSTDTADPNYLMAYLPLGTHEIEWSATDEFGNSSTLVQKFNVLYDSNENCCERSYFLWEGTSGPDFYIAHPAFDPVWNEKTMSLCAFGHESADIILMANEFETLGVDETNDYINFGDGGTGGWGGAFLQWKPGESTVISESGDDVIIFHRMGNDNWFYDMGGDDNIEGSTGFPDGMFGDDIIFAGFGQDFITTFDGDDYIVPGPGKDVSRAGNGDDTIVVYNMCELVPGEIIQGGAGYDTLYLPVSKEEALAFGLIFDGIENVIVDVDGARRGFADCAIIYEEF